MDFLLAILPIGLLIYVMTKKKSWPSHISLPLAATLVYAFALVHSRLDPNLVNATVVNGTLSALTPRSIIWGGNPAFKNDAAFRSRTNHRRMA